MTAQPLARLSLFANHRAQAVGRFVTMAELAQMAQSPTTGPKDEAALIVPFESDGKTGSHAQAAMFAAVVIDHDNDNKTEADIRHLYGPEGLDVCYLAFTSASHQQPKNKEPALNRWKVVVPFSQPVDADTAAQISVGIAYSLASDPAQARKQQGFYAPNKVTADAPYIAITDTLGEPWEWLQPDDADSVFIQEAARGWADFQAAEEAKASTTKAKPRTSTLSAGAGIVERIQATYDLAQLLEQNGYKRKGRGLYLSPFSSTGVAGVKLLERDGKQVVYSHHGAACPLSSLNHDGHSLDVVDVLCSLQYGGDYQAMVTTLDPEGNKQRQREFMQQKAAAEAAAALGADTVAALDVLKTDSAGNLAGLVSGQPAPAADSESASQSQPGPLQAMFEPQPPYNLFGSFALPDLPMELVPQVIAEYAQDQGEVIGADPAALVMFGLGIGAAVIHDNITIQPKRYDHTWTESARLWCGVIGDPSTKKSPLLKKAAAPAYSTNRSWIDKSKKDLAEWEAACIEAKENDETLPPKPVAKRLIFEDATVASLQSLMADIEQRGVLVIRDELAGWLGSMDAYKQGAGSIDKPAWLEFYNGGPKVFDRVGRGSGYVENWGGCVVGGIQPSVINAYAQAAEHDGMLQRFILYFAKQATRGVDRAPDPFAFVNYKGAIEHLAALESCNQPVELSEEAHRHREALDDKIHALMCNHPNQFLTAALGKWSGLFARLLLVYHCLDSYQRGEYPTAYQVTGETAEQVATLMWRILLPHSLKFYNAIDPLQDSSQDLARLILAKGWRRFTVKRDFNQHWKASRRMKPWEISQTLERLEGFNWITPDLTTRPNIDGSPTAYVVNPQVHILHAEQAEVERHRRAEVARAMAELSA